jgi:hypothetical protein
VKLTIAAATLGSAIVLATAPGIASAAVQNAPVALDNVHIVQSYGIFNNFDPGRVSVRFTNKNGVAATGVTFNLVAASGAILAQYNDIGTYLPGQTVKHDFTDTHEENNQRIEVASVRFSDGTSWSAPSGPIDDTPFFPGS